MPRRRVPGMVMKLTLRVPAQRSKKKASSRGPDFTPSAPFSDSLQASSLLKTGSVSKLILYPILHHLDFNSVGIPHAGDYRRSEKARAEPEGEVNGRLGSRVGLGRGGIHPVVFGSRRCFSRRFPFAIIMSLKAKRFAYRRFMTVGKIRPKYDGD